MENINYSAILDQTHTLIAGTTGSGKSVLLNGIMYHALQNTPENANFCLIDLKRVELIAYKNLPHTIAYADNINSAISALNKIVSGIDKRYNRMQQNKQRTCNYTPIYVIIDELADLMTVAKKEILPLLQRIGQIGRAANVHLICATQCPLASVIPTSLKVNFTCIIGLHTRSKQDSRNIIGVNGCESLPLYGYGYMIEPSKEMQLYSIPYMSDSDIDLVTSSWKQYKSSNNGNGLVKFLIAFLIAFGLVYTIVYLWMTHFISMFILTGVIIFLLVKFIKYFPILKKSFQIVNR